MKMFPHSANRIGRRTPALLALGLVLLLAASGCGKEATPVPSTKDKSAEKSAPVRVETLKKGPVVVTIALTGAVEAARIAQLASAAEGPVLAVRVREGDMVMRGQVLVTLGRTEGAAALVTSLREDLRKEEDNLDRTRRLVESGALAGEQLDIAAANAARLRAQLVKGQESTRDYVVAAPWAGIVSRMKVREGDVVAPRAPLAEIYDPKSLLVRLSLPEQDVAGVALGTTAAVELDAYPGQRFSGSVTRLYPYLDSRTRTRIIEVVLVNAPSLLPGMFARAYLTRQTIAGAITVPAHSLVALAGGGSGVYIAQDGKAVRRKVETGIEVDGRVHIVTGLGEGDKLIVAGQESLKEGAPVQLPGAGSKSPATAANPTTPGDPTAKPATDPAIVKSALPQ